jgi:hypothetical protein
MTSGIPRLSGPILAIAGALVLAVVGISVSLGAAATAGSPGQGAPGGIVTEEALAALATALATDLAIQSPASVPASGAPLSGALASGAAPSGAPAPAPSNPPARPATLDGPVPSDLRPTLANAARDFPKPYLDHCHAGQAGRAWLVPCLYGNLTSRTTIALFGDSHALSWFPAVEGVAKREGWRLLDLTMSTCSPADIPIWNASLTQLNTACATWRASAIKRLIKERPAIILVTGTRGFAAAAAPGTALVGDARALRWAAGMQRTLARLVPAAGKVIVIADTPLSIVDPPVCLAKHATSVLACATPVARAINDAWLKGEHDAADRAGAGFIDPALWVCPSSPCPAVIGHFLVYRNPGHLTAVFAATLAARLRSAIKLEVAKPRPPA